MGKISAVIITKNEAENIGRCLQSLQGVADELIVLDAFSEDDTVETATALGARVIQREWQGFSASKNFANSQATHNYILSLDADEELSEELREAILDVKPTLTGAYSFNRLTAYAGRWIKHCGWYPDVKLRVFPKEGTQWEGEYVHETLKFPQNIAVNHLKGDLYHYSIKSVEDHLERINRYTNLSAEEMFQRGKQASWVKLYLSPFYRFFSMYVLKGGFLDGYAGYQICKISAFATYLRYAKLREKHRLNTKGS
ncbi:MAG: glycosyltransferase family 2 protein [Bacteroidota bacterium]